MLKIYTFAHKRPDFLEIQLKSFQKNLEDDFEFIVFNNAIFDINKSDYNNINTWCKDNNIQCIDIENNKILSSKFNGEILFNVDGTYANSYLACAYPLCWAWTNIISKTDDKICIIDSDMFFIEKENISNLLDKYDIIYNEQLRGHIYYMWNGIVFANLSTLPDASSINWWCGRCEGIAVDVGGQTYHYLKKYKDQIKNIKSESIHFDEDPDCGFSPANYEYICLEGRRSILHYIAGSNWNNMSPDYHNKKTEWLKNKL